MLTNVKPFIAPFIAMILVFLALWYSAVLGFLIAFAALILILRARRLTQAKNVSRVFLGVLCIACGLMVYRGFFYDPYFLPANKFTPAEAEQLILKIEKRAQHGKAIIDKRIKNSNL